MIARKSNKNVRPDKPYETFPLSASGNGQWCRRIAGKVHYFGPWNDPMGSLERHNKEYPYLKVGMSPPAQYDGLTLAKVCNAYLTHKNSLLTSGEISELCFADVTGACELLIECFGKETEQRSRRLTSITLAT